ncbi:MAG: FliH/SctL family protein [Eubacteriales bacterium]
MVDNFLMLNRRTSESKIINDTQDMDEEPLGAIKQQAERIINHAVVFREQTMKQTEDEAAEIFEQARQTGYKKGYSEGVMASKKENKALTDKLVELINAIEHKQDSFLDDNRNSVIILACDIVRKIIDRQLESDDEAFVNIFKKATRDLYGKKHIRLTVSAYEKNFVTSSSEYLLSLVKGADGIEIDVLEDAARGTCIIETDDEIIDASAKVQTDTIEQALLDL